MTTNQLNRATGFHFSVHRRTVWLLRFFETISEYQRQVNQLLCRSETIKESKEWISACKSGGLGSVPYSSRGEFREREERSSQKKASSLQNIRGAQTSTCPTT
jgi:hypothetical protein